MATGYKGTPPILWITAGVRRYLALMLMRGVAELLNKGRLNARARTRGKGVGLTPLSLCTALHCSRVTVCWCIIQAQTPRVLPRRCCALTCPKVSVSNERRSEERSLATTRRCQSAEDNLRVNTRARVHADNYPIFSLRRVQKYTLRVCIARLNIQILTILNGIVILSSYRGPWISFRFFRDKRKIFNLVSKNDESGWCMLF